MNTPENSSHTPDSDAQPPNHYIREARRLLTGGRLNEAEAVLRKVLQLLPNHAETCNQLGMLLVKLGRPEEAVRHFARAVEINPDSARILNNLGAVLKKLGHIDDAISSLENAINIEPSNFSAHMNIAIIQETTGRLDEAASHFRQVIALKPDFAQAHFHLAHLHNHASSADEIQAMMALYSQPATVAEQRIWLAFGLGSALEKQGEYAQAFDYYEAGHAIRKQSMLFDLNKSTSFVRGLIEVFNKKDMARNRASGPDSDLPIFVFGMPRSGTSLAEQILASHPDVQGAGELTFVEDTLRQIIDKTGKPFLESWNGLDSHTIRVLGEIYLGKLASYAGGRIHVADTTPMNFLYVGLIATILPNARLVHCMRDPMDTCLSIFTQPLSDTQSYANDLADLGGFYSLYRELMAHWRSVLRGRMHDLCYEDLITDSETGIRNLLDYCGLPFNENCLAFHKTERPVRTPSASQVRQPLYTSSIGRWKRFESRLSPLKSILQSSLV